MRIVAIPDLGAGIATMRNDVHYVIAGYWIASLRGKTLHQRDRELIAIAHPDFRQDCVPSVWPTSVLTSATRPRGHPGHLKAPPLRQAPLKKRRVYPPMLTEKK